MDRKIAELEAHLMVGEYYIDGVVPRAGVYSLTGRKISLKQAIAAAGGLEHGREEAFISILRRDGDHEGYVLQNQRFTEILNMKKPDVYLHPNDVIRVTDKPMELPTSTSRPVEIK